MRLAPVAAHLAAAPGATVVVVGSDRTIADFVVAILALDGHAAEVVPDAHAGLEAAVERRRDLLVLTATKGIGIPPHRTPEFMAEAYAAGIATILMTAGCCSEPMSLRLATMGVPPLVLVKPRPVGEVRTTIARALYLGWLLRLRRAADEELREVHAEACAQIQDLLDKTRELGYAGCGSEEDSVGVLPCPDGDATTAQAPGYEAE